MTWEEFEPELAYWPELYVLDTTAKDWRRLLDFVRARGFETRFQHGPEIQPGLLEGLQPLPKDPNGLFDGDVDVGDMKQHSLLEVIAGGITLSALFYTRDQVELHLNDPREVHSEERAKTLFEFMREVGQALGKPVRMTPESMCDNVICEYDPAGDALRKGPEPGV